MLSNNHFDVIIVGGGAAGLMAAIFATQKGLQTAIFEKMPSPGRKLLRTGGGRCNLTNHAPLDTFCANFGQAHRFVKPALTFFPPETLKRFFHSHQLPLHSPDGFHVYPTTEKSSDILQALLRVSMETGVTIFSSTRGQDLLIEEQTVTGVVTEKATFHSKNVILATGGMSHPSTGSTGDGYQLAKAAGHTIVTPLPALVELYCKEDWIFELAGVSLPSVTIRVPSTSLIQKHEELLFTHKGVSGPAALNISGAIVELLQTTETISVEINLISEMDVQQWELVFQEWRQFHGRTKIVNLLDQKLPASLARLIAYFTSTQDLIVSQLTREKKESIIKFLTRFPLTIKGHGGFEKAMLTKGGISLQEVDSKSLASKKIKGLYFAGEILDVQGPCGGYNLQWAFSSGALAANHIVHTLLSN